MNSETTKISERKKSCVNCGAALTYAPGTDFINCDYCGHKETIDNTGRVVHELALDKYLEQLGSQSHAMEITLLHCKNCGANQHIEEHYKSLHCVYCTQPLIVEDTYKEQWIVPGAVLPFQMDQKKAHAIFKKWVAGLWWAPTNLQRASLSPENTKGLYLPYWTFDAQLKATYSGERGEYYYVTKTVGSGKNRRTVRERRTRWYPASGTVSGFVDDTLVKATKQQSSQLPSKITRWDLSKLEAFNSSYLAGYVTEKYTLPLQDGHVHAKQEAEQIATNWARRDIGGDTQRVHRISMTLENETFKHILLPVYISSYRYDNKRYSFYINGQTGVIHGERPYSFWKIFLAIVAVLALLGIIFMFMQGA